jgi:hypothetical protein
MQDKREWDQKAFTKKMQRFMRDGRDATQREEKNEMAYDAMELNMLRGVRVLEVRDNLHLHWIWNCNSRMTDEGQDKGPNQRKGAILKAGEGKRRIW